LEFDIKEGKNKVKKLRDRVDRRIATVADLDGKVDLLEERVEGLFRIHLVKVTALERLGGYTP